MQYVLLKPILLSIIPYNKCVNVLWVTDCSVCVHVSVWVLVASLRNYAVHQPATVSYWPIMHSLARLVRLIVKWAKFTWKLEFSLNLLLPCNRNVSFTIEWAINQIRVNKEKIKRQHAWLTHAFCTCLPPACLLTDVKFNSLKSAKWVLTYLWTSSFSV